MHKFCGPICLIMHLIILCAQTIGLCDPDFCVGSDACLSWELYNEVKH